MMMVTETLRKYAYLEQGRPIQKLLAITAAALRIKLSNHSACRIKSSVAVDVEVIVGVICYEDHIAALTVRAN